MKRIIILCFILGLAAYTACTHEPFPAPPPIVNPNDTIDPIDTNNTSKPCHPDTVYYMRDIQPILTANCAYSGCHDATTATEGVVLDNYENVLSTGDIDPFNPDGSDLYEVLVENDLDKRMPYQLPPLSQSNIDLIKKWINQGALNLSCDDCDTTGLTYSADISAIFTQNCINCHASNNSSTSRRLTTFQEVQDAMNNTNLLQRINAHPGVAVMPQGGKMPQCNIDKIEAWFNNGMPQ